MKYRILLGLLLSVVTALASAAPGWQLPTGYFVPAKMPMTVVFPRPDAETNTWARQRLAYADGTVAYRLPVAIQGGAYPFHFDLLSGPPGMAIGQDIYNTDYGIVTWTPATTGGPYAVSVQVTDQELNTVTVNWSVTATTTGFLFVDPKASINGTGTKASPFNSVAPLFVLHGTTGAYPGAIVYFRSGTTVLSGPESIGNVQLQSNANPAVWLGYPGEDAIIDFSHSKVLVDNQHDVFVGGLHFMNARNDVTNAQFFFFNQNVAQNRMTFFENKFENIYDLASGDSNQAAILFFNPGTLRQYFTLIGCSLNHYTAEIVDVYAIKYGVIENNQLLAGNGSSPWAGIFLKSDVQNFSVRRNTSLSQTYGYGGIYIPQQAQYFTNANIEVAYNTILSGDVTKPAFVYEWMGAGNQGKNMNPTIYAYRNTFLGKVQGLDDFPYTVFLEKNVLINTAGNYGDTSGTFRVITATDNLTGTPANGLIDQNGNLADSASQYRGTRGHELVFGVDPLNAPVWR